VKTKTIKLPALQKSRDSCTLSWTRCVELRPSKL
jgi:hypothetical protein